MNNSNGQKNPQKEKILAQSRKASKDEGMEHAVIKGLKLSTYIAGCVGLFLSIIFMIVGNRDAVTGIVLIYISFDIGKNLSLYRFTGEKKYLVLLIFDITIGILLLASMTMYLLHNHFWSG